MKHSFQVLCTALIEIHYIHTYIYMYIQAYHLYKALHRTKLEYLQNHLSRVVNPCPESYVRISMLRLYLLKISFCMTQKA